MLFLLLKIRFTGTKVEVSKCYTHARAQNLIKTNDKLSIFVDFLLIFLTKLVAT